MDSLYWMHASVWSVPITMVATLAAILVELILKGISRRAREPKDAVPPRPRRLALVLRTVWAVMAFWAPFCQWQSARLAHPKDMLWLEIMIPSVVCIVLTLAEISLHLRSSPSAFVSETLLPFTTAMQMGALGIAAIISFGVVVLNALAWFLGFMFSGGVAR